MSVLTSPRRTAAIQCVAGIFALLASFRAGAAIPELCVHNQAEFNQAILAAGSAPYTIKVQEGIYALDETDLSTGFDILASGTSLLGGYQNDCTQRVIGTDAFGQMKTELDAINFRVFMNFAGDLTIDNVHLNSPGGFEFVPFLTKPGPIVTIRRVTVSGAQTPYDIAAILMNWEYLPPDADFGGEIHIIDSLITGNEGGSDYYRPYLASCDIVLYVGEGQSPAFFLTNNTVMHNNVGETAQSGGVCFQNNNGGNAVLLAHNNIFYDNVGDDLYSDSPNLELVNNTMLAVQIPVQGNTVLSGNSTLNPQLDSSFHPIEPGSRSINTGDYDSADLPATDLAGNPRVIGTKVDRGAYESSVDDGFLLTVTNTQDGDNPPPAGSLRAAITNANANGGGEISFAIGSDCSPRKVITLTKGLPAITAPVSILGYSQPGASKNTLDVGDDAVVCIVLDGNGSVLQGLVAADTPNSVLDVQGIAFSGFTSSAIRINGGSNHNISGNRIGGVVGTITLAPSPYGVYINSGVSGLSIGGSDPANRNMIGEATSDGIYVAGPSGQTPAASHVSILGNYVGVGWNNLTGDYVDRGNAVKGIHVLGSDNTIDGNVVGFNGNDGIDLDGTAATGNFVESNYIGASQDTVPVGNGSMGVRVENGGHDNKIRSNSIGYNSGTGVRIVSGLGNTIRRNSIFDNNSYGIDLAAGGVTANDDDSQVGALLLANRALNFPVLTLATGTETSGIVTGTLQSTQGTYLIDVYSNPACDGSNHGEGAYWLGSTKVTIDPVIGQVATAAFKLTIANPGIMFLQLTPITATATDANGNVSPGNTSEFSACLVTTYDGIFANGFQSPP